MPVQLIGVVGESILHPTGQLIPPCWPYIALLAVPQSYGRLLKELEDLSRPTRPAGGRGGGKGLSQYNNLCTI